MNALQRISLFGWQWVAESKIQVINILKKHLDNDSADLLSISTANPEQVMLAQQAKQFFQTVKNEFDLVLPDGEGIVLASRLLRNRTEEARILERLAGVEIVSKLISRSSLKHGSILVIGGKGYQNSEIKIDSARFSFREVTNSNELTVDSSNKYLFWLPAYEDAKHPTMREQELVESVIKKLKPKLVFVALGAPQQEFWVVKHKKLLKDSGVKIAMVVGGAFDMLTGKVPRAPRLMRQLKLEWFWRLIQEPSRWRRQLALINYILYLAKLLVRTDINKRAQ
ncbi:MAG TPA: WecB/TagA/CpsF family glycosyltransferase [Candidatus Woesebacteria bacterium]|nr:WecB/TagA/CpsF family glycosyltransferase [Candidatus Woesebacteria bacterium]HNS65092.1 WecB/TagA/CpsF family glycosyltransferase [Candidatus Woesebacteria bacterium]